LLALALAVEGDQRLAAGQDAEAVTAYEKALCHGEFVGVWVG
jgi:predicted negative regulator of RcsB-dependent stress response